MTFFSPSFSIPLPLCGSGYIATKTGFTTYVVISIMCASSRPSSPSRLELTSSPSLPSGVFYGAFAVVVYPLWEYRQSIAEISRNMWADIRGKRSVH